MSEISFCRLICVIAELYNYQPQLKRKSRWGSSPHVNYRFVLTNISCLP